MTVAPSSETDELITYCARHPKVETGLRCGNCGTPICPRCLVTTPVGARCPTCARVKRVALLAKPADLARSTVFGLAVAIVGRILLAMIPILSFLGILGPMLVGFLVGEAVARGANRKRARELAVLAVVCFLVGWVVAAPLLFVVQLGPAVSGALPGLLVQSIVSSVVNVMALVGLAVGALLAWMRNR